MTDTPQRPPLPDRLSADTRSPHHVAAVFEHEIGIRLNDNERKDVEEYCISEEWVKVPAGKTVDRKGHPMLIKAQRQGGGLLPVSMRRSRVGISTVSFRRIQRPLAAST
jgi:hypothetical protein